MDKLILAATRFGGSFVTAAAEGVRANGPTVAEGLRLSMSAARSLISETTAASFTDTTAWSILREYGIVSLVLYAVAGALGFTVLAPVTAILAFLSPGLIWSAILALPYIAWEMLTLRRPEALNELFGAALQKLSPRSAGAFSAGLRRNPLHEGLLGRARLHAFRYFNYARHSLTLGAIGFIPLIGPLVTGFGQWARTSEEIAFTSLQPFFQSHGWSLRKSSRFVDQHKWLLVGFFLPYTLLNAIPVVNAVAMVFAQRAAAFLVEHKLQPLVEAGQAEATPASAPAAAAASSEQEHPSAPLASPVKKPAPRRHVVEEETHEEERAPIQELQPPTGGGPASAGDELRRIAALPASDRLTPTAAKLAAAKQQWGQQGAGSPRQRKNRPVVGSPTGGAQ